MGKRGPAKTPASVHERRGTYREDRHGGGLLPGTVPAKPDGLSARAAAEWDRLAEDLAQAGLLNDRFAMVFAGYCECVAEYWDHKRTVATQGYTAETSNGNVIQHPAVGMMGKCLDRMLKLEKELGLTPAAATGLQPGSAGERDPLEELEQNRAAGQKPPEAQKQPAKTGTKQVAKKRATTKKSSRNTSAGSSRGKS